MYGSTSGVEQHSPAKILLIFFGVTSLLVYWSYSRSEKRRLSIVQTYAPLDPDSVVPRASELHELNEEKLKRAILEGESFIREELAKHK